MLFGVDGKTGDRVPVERVEYSEWWSRVAMEFDGTPPVTTVLVIVDEIHAVLFEPLDPPYVVRNPDFGTSKTSIAWEVPWREGTGTRSARHSDLIRLLVPRMQLPSIECLEGSLRLFLKPPQVGSQNIELKLPTYIVPSPREQVVIPFHRCAARFGVGAESLQFEWVRSAFFAVPSVGMIRTTNTELICDGPGMAEFRVWGRAPLGILEEAQSVLVTVTLGVAHANHTVVITTALARKSPNPGNDLIDFEV